MPLFVLLPGCLSAQQAGIEGIVVDSITHQPMPRVHITLRPATAEGAGPEDVYGAMSRADGHFSIAGMKPDAYAVTAQHNGYLLVPDPSTTVELKAGETRSDFIVRMTPHAVISGRVLDQYGDPIQRAQVEASPAGQNPIGAGTLAVVDTDERGQFRLPLPPGKFYIKATTGYLQMRLAPEIRSDGTSAPVYAATFYPATESKDQARIVEAGAGHEVTGIDIRLVQKRSLKITGVVTGIPENSPPAVVAVFSGGGGRGGFHIRGESMPAADGRFTVANLPSGRYRLLAMQGESLKSQVVDVQLENTDESGVSMALQHGETLSGTLAIEGGKAEKMTVRLESEFQTKSTDAGPDGTFQIDQVFPGTFRVNVQPLPENAYIKSVKVDDTEAPGGMLDLSRGVAGSRVKVTISPKGGQVEGAVLGTDGEPLRSPVAFVILVSTAAEIDKGNFKYVEAGTKFRYTGLRPGKYRLIAADGRDFAGEIENSEELFAKAPEVEVHESDRITKDVKVFNAP